MSLHGRKIDNRKDFNRLSLKEWPKGIDPDESLTLLGHIRQDICRDIAIKRIIEGHLRLAISIVGRYMLFFDCNHLFDDLSGAAFEGVVVAANRLHTLKHNNVTGYIVRYIHNFVSVALKKSPVVPTPRGHVPVKIKQIDHHDCGYSDDFVQSDILDNLTRTKEERNIVDLRIKGYTDQEIANTLKIPTTRVFRIRKTLKERYYG